MPLSVGLGLRLLTVPTLILTLPRVLPILPHVERPTRPPLRVSFTKNLTDTQQIIPGLLPLTISRAVTYLLTTILPMVLDIVRQSLRRAVLLTAP